MEGMRTQEKSASAPAEDASRSQIGAVNEEDASQSDTVLPALGSGPVKPLALAAIS